MYLTEPRLSDIVLKQFRFKMNAHAAAFTTLVIIQAISLLLGVTEYGFEYFSSSFSNVTWIELSNSSPVGLTMVWAFVLGIILSSATRRNEPFSFVTTRLSNQFANFLFMLTASLISGVTAALTGSAVKLFAFLRHGEVIVQTTGLIGSPSDFFIRILTAVAYTLLFFLLGYTVSSLIQFNKLFILIFVVGWFSSSIVIGDWNSEPYVERIIKFIGMEQSLPLFLIKVAGAVLLLFGISAASTNRVEVRN